MDTFLVLRAISVFCFWSQEDEANTFSGTKRAKRTFTFLVWTLYGWHLFRLWEISKRR